jgi:hypothetical protein
MQGNGVRQDSFQSPFSKDTKAILIEPNSHDSYEQVLWLSKACIGQVFDIQQNLEDKK